MLNLWLSIDGVFLSLYGLGSALFLVVVIRSTSYVQVSASPCSRSVAVIC
jgi:hypothetical protein